MMQRRLVAQRSQQRLIRQEQGEVRQPDVYEGCTRSEIATELNNEAVELAKNGNPEEAVPLLLSALRYDSSDGWIWLSLARVFSDLKDYMSAKECAEEGLRLFDNLTDINEAKKRIKTYEASMSDK